MPRGKRGRGGARGRGRGKAKAEEEEIQEVEQSQEEGESSQPEAVQESDATVEQEKQEMDQEEQTAVTEDSADEGALTNGQAKRKADDDDDSQDDAKRAKTEDDEEDGPKTVTLFCGNLAADLTSETLKGFFETNGIDVTNARKMDRKSKCYKIQTQCVETVKRRFGYVDINEESLDSALELNNKMINGEAVRIDLSKPKGADDSSSRVQGGDDMTLFVKNLSQDVTEEMLREFFQDDGEVSEIRLPKRRDGLCKGFGYVVFDSSETVEKIIKDKQGVEFQGEKLFLDFTNDKSDFKPRDKKGSKEFGMFAPSKVLFVRNLSFQVTEEELKEVFEGCLACRIPPNEYGQPKGFAFVEFESVEEAESAQKEKDGLEINGRVVQLAFASDKPTGASGGGGGMGGGRRFGGGGGRWGGGGYGGGWGGGRGGYGGGWGGGGPRRGGGGYSGGGGGGYGRGGGGGGGRRRGGAGAMGFRKRW